MLHSLASDYVVDTPSIDHTCWSSNGMCSFLQLAVYLVPYGTLGIYEIYFHQLFAWMTILISFYFLHSLQKHFGILSKIKHVARCTYWFHIFIKLCFIFTFQRLHSTLKKFKTTFKAWTFVKPQPLKPLYELWNQSHLQWWIRGQITMMSVNSNFTIWNISFRT